MERGQRHFDCTSTNGPLQSYECRGTVGKRVRRIKRDDSEGHEEGENNQSQAATKADNKSKSCKNSFK
ncbi:hypothetical protein LIPSTDRAFT_71913 [Lipomyces starkeyi NRRL Y-11557]|uniref:Uncharacterized protein n=1 Tax=Lipomyces starkeyi NRRL Y-11557 TaxID=675824 RepID=A0A1E3Q3U9_LIPST|nr:hypothetical protein LIPSTDRAFT_71913 [Lipomyces starkeyi NRRL Y-11557]